MYMLVSIKKWFKSKWILVIVIVAFLILCMVVNKKIDILKFGRQIINSDNKVLEDVPYNAEYELTVVSNKNTNTYHISEWFNNGKYRYEAKDPLGNVIITTYDGNTLKIRNMKEKNVLNISYASKIQNLSSYHTYIELYKYINEENTCGSKYEVYEKEDKIEVHIHSCTKNDCECMVSNILNNNKIDEVVLVIDKDTKFPQTIILYDKDKVAKYCIVYIRFISNTKYEDTLFK